MKYSFFLLLVFFSGRQLYAQTQIGFHYRIANKWKIYTDDDPSNTTTKEVIPHKKLKAKCYEKEGMIHVDFWQIKPETDSTYMESSAYVNSKDPNTMTIRFNPRQLIGQPYEFISIPYSATEVGVVTIPFKYRFGYRINDSITAQNDVSTTVNAGLYLGHKWGKTRFFPDKDPVNTLSFTLGGFLGPTIIGLEADNTKSGKGKSNELGVSSGILALFATGDFNIGIAVGRDLILNNKARDWFYANKSWIGFGIGYNIGFLGGKN